MGREGILPPVPLHPPATFLTADPLALARCFLSLLVATHAQCKIGVGQHLPQHHLSAQGHEWTWTETWRGGKAPDTVEVEVMRHPSLCVALCWWSTAPGEPEGSAHKKVLQNKHRINAIKVQVSKIRNLLQLPSPPIFFSSDQCEAKIIFFHPQNLPKYPQTFATLGIFLGAKLAWNYIEPHFSEGWREFFSSQGGREALSTPWGVVVFSPASGNPILVPPWGAQP